MVDEALNGGDGRLELRDENEPLPVEDPEVKRAAVVIVQDGQMDVGNWSCSKSMTSGRAERSGRSSRARRLNSFKLAWMVLQTGMVNVW